jgi:methylmalonyl-CoA mutase N-terminal domain/subunit
MSATPTSNVDALRAKYDKAAAEVQKLMPGTPEYHAAREAKKAAFIEWDEADKAKAKQDDLNAKAEQAQAAADAAAAAAKAATKAAHPAHAPAHAPAHTAK